MNLSAWIMAARPRTLSLSTTPVVIGAALAWAVQRGLHWPVFMAALAGSMLIQVGTNLHKMRSTPNAVATDPTALGRRALPPQACFMQPPSDVRLLAASPWRR
jgi:hypothetical protein